MSTVMFERFLNELHEPGSVNLSPSRLAEKMAVQIQDLAVSAGVHRNTIRTHPESPRLQGFLRDVVRVMSAASVSQPDAASAAFWVKNTPIPSFRHKTAYQLVAEGRTDDVVSYLESIQSGYVG